MKQYDKNSLIGFVLMAIILIVFNTFFFPEVPQEQAPTTTPTEAVISETQIAETVIDAPIIPTLNDSIVSEELKATYGIFAAAAIGEDEFQIIENDKLKITVANKGGRITSVILKEYQTFDSLALDLFDADSSRFNLQFTTGHNINTADLYFVSEQRYNTLSMKLKADDSHYVEYLYTLTDDYLIDFDINFVGMESIIPSGVNYMNLEWQMKTPKTEKSKTNQDMYTGDRKSVV